MALQDILGNGVGPSGTTASLPGESFQTDLLDLTQPLLGIEVVPAKPGYAPIIFSPEWVIESVSGTQTSPPVYNAGTNPAHTNYNLAANTPTNAATNAAVPPCLAVGPSSTLPIQLTPNAPVIMDITAGAQGTGSFSLKARLLLTVAWIAVGG